jgi:predicted lipoprotein with Yx(FWY)xxD motif
MNDGIADDCARRRALGVVAIGALAVLAFLAASSLAGGATRPSATVSLRKTTLGMVLVARNGHTLYLFGKDRSGRSACSGSCAQFWPPLLTRGTPTAGVGVRAALLGTTKRSDGSIQVTYARHPLYTYKLDTRAGQTKGEGTSFFGGVWNALSARGTAVVKGTTQTTTGTTPPPTTTSPYP